MIEEQTVKARAVEYELGYTSSDSEQIRVEFVLLEGPNENAHINWLGFFTEKTTEHTLKALRTCGWVGDDLSDLQGFDQNEVFLVIEHEEDLEGQLRPRVRWINAGAGAFTLKNKMDAGAAKAFAERMKGHELAQKQRTMGTPTPEPQSKRTPAANGGGGRRPQPNTAAQAARANRGTRPAQREPGEDDIPY
jgi:hypothetical protein